MKVLVASYMFILYCCCLLFSSSLKMVQLRQFVKLLRKAKMITRLVRWCTHIIIAFLNTEPQYVYGFWFCTIMIYGHTCTCTCKIKVDLCNVHSLCSITYPAFACTCIVEIYMQGNGPLRNRLSGRLQNRLGGRLQKPAGGYTRHTTVVPLI